MDDKNAAAGDHHEPASVLIHKSGSNKGATSVVGVTAGAVVISIARTSHHKPGSEGNAQVYHSQREKDAPSSPSGGNDDPFFLAVMAPTPDAAMQFLSNRPPGAHILVKDEDDNVAVFVKFRQAVRAVVLIKAKEMKKLDEPITWGRPYKAPHPVQANAASHRDQRAQPHSTMMTPVHRMKLAADLYLQLEQCWKRFLPQVKAILLQMCCEPYFDEDLVMDNWATIISSSQMPCIVALTPQSCGFYILSTNSGVSSSSGSSANNSGAVPIRHVEFDYQKIVITVADGTFNPAAFIVSTHFSSKRLFDVDLTYVPCAIHITR
uniref:Uncharacterized protein n=1 Tax=Globisporangium ultimum (strain ATCC 200006 / CBS 805.95 / DAOM BR144) TaxID=431595 RepID=K3WBM2_GLOUD